MNRNSPDSHSSSVRQAMGWILQIQSLIFTLCLSMHWWIQCWTEWDLVLTHWGWDKMAANFADNICKWIFLKENCCIMIKISLRYICKGPIYANPALVQIMAPRRTGDKSLSEPMIALFGDYASLWPRWVKGTWQHTCQVTLDIPGKSMGLLEISRVTWQLCDCAVHPLKIC